MHRRHAWLWIGGSLAAPLGITPSTGLTGGSTHVVIRVADSTGAVSAAIDGTNVTGFAIDDATHVSGNTVAHAAGPTNVTVTDGHGTSAPLVGGFTYELPSEATEDPTGWWEGPYGGSPLTPTVSAGTSGSDGDLITHVALAAEPDVGPAVDGVATIEYATPLHAAMQGPGTVTSALIGAAGHPFTLIALVRSGAVPAAPSGGPWYTDPCIIADSGGWFGMSETSAGVLAGVDGPAITTARIAVAASTWYMAATRLGGGTLRLRVNQADTSPVACAGPAGSGASLVFGVNYGNVAFTKGRGLAYVVYNYAVSDAQLASWYAYFKAKYPAAGLP